MRSARTAETILSYVMEPRRASATVGDLLEFRPAAGAFWSSVLRTFFGSVVRQAIASPREMAKMAGGTLIMTPVAMVVNAILASPLMWAGNEEILVTALKFVWVPFCVARQVARKQPGKELSAWIGMGGAVLVSLAAARLTTLEWIELSELFPAWQMLPVMLAGVAFERRRWLKKGAIA
jgi:hypothetical protein